MARDSRVLHVTKRGAEVVFDSRLGIGGARGDKREGRMRARWVALCLLAVGCKMLGVEAYAPTSPQLLGRGIFLRSGWTGMGMRPLTKGDPSWGWGRPIAMVSATGVVRRELRAKGGAELRAGTGVDDAVPPNGQIVPIKPLVISGPSGVGKVRLGFRMCRQSWGVGFHPCQSVPHKSGPPFFLPSDFA